MRSNKNIIKDINGRKYLIKDLSEFVKHIREFHNFGSSIHEEEGYYFRVNEAFRNKVYSLKKK